MLVDTLILKVNWKFEFKSEFPFSLTVPKLACTNNLRRWDQRQNYWERFGKYIKDLSSFSIFAVCYNSSVNKQFGLQFLFVSHVYGNRMMQNKSFFLCELVQAWLEQEAHLLHSGGHFFRPTAKQYWHIQEELSYHGGKTRLMSFSGSINKTKFLLLLKCLY